MKKYETFLYSAAGLAALFIILVAFNYLASSAAVRADLTEGRLYTLSEGTKKILGKLDGPVKLRLYVSQSDNAIPVQLRSFAQRVEDLVREFKSVAGPNLIIEKYNPKPDSDEEDAAQLDGVEPQTLFSGEQFYLGLSVSRLDRKQSLSNISQQRERLLEYDLIRAIARVANSERPTIGVMSAVPVLGEPMNFMTRQSNEPWVLANELKRDFNVKPVGMNTEFLGYRGWVGEIARSRNGALVAAEAGTALSYGMANAQERGMLFISPGDEVYGGMVVGLHAKDTDLDVNVCRAKQLTNIRSSTSDIAVKLTPPSPPSLERSLSLINNDEMVEVTPKNIRIRKTELNPNLRAREAKRARFAAMEA